MNISRTLATRIMSKAVEQQYHCLLGLIDSSGYIYFSIDESEIRQRLEQNSTSILFYNQHADAIRFIESYSFVDGQISIEIFQDTKGVFGLRCYQMIDRMQQPVSLVFDESLT